VADHERQSEQPELEEVQRPRERLQPLVVEGGRDHERDQSDARPHQAANECRSAGEHRLTLLDAVRVGHDQAEDRQEAGVGGQLQVEGPPGRTDRAGSPIGDARRLGADHAHDVSLSGWLRVIGISSTGRSCRASAG
jgi:hypothetical protein